MRHGSLFSGVGGFDLAAEWIGWTNVFHCEINEFGQKILKYYWPNAITYTDITKTDFSIHRGEIDVLTGGFPCQPFSTAGRRKGTDDNRYLWPQMLRVIGEIQPTWIVGENVYGILNWSKGMVFEQVQADLEAKGYETLPLILPACGVGANHIRRRVWFVAHSNGSNDTGKRQHRTGTRKASKVNAEQKERERLWAEFKNNVPQWDATNSQRFGQQGPWECNEPLSTKEDSDWKTSRSFHVSGGPTVSPVYERNDGLPAGLDTEAISEKDWLEGAHTAIGNAVVPQVVYEIFKAIDEN